MAKKLLVLGASGLTGYKIASIASEKYDVLGTYNARPTRIEGCQTRQVDVTDEAALGDLFSAFEPDLVINTTALHSVDFCEDNPSRAFSVNSEAVGFMKKNCDRYDSRLVHISTDYVFNGGSSSPYSEDDVPVPVSRYGESKLSGEKMLEGSSHVVVRPSVVYGWTPLELSGTASSSGKPMNFAMWLLTRLHNNEALNIVTDQFATATLADSLAEASLRLAGTGAGGTFHVAGTSCESRFDFSVKLAREFGFDPGLIRPADSSQLRQKAKRPPFSCLDCSRAAEFGLRLLSTEESLKIMKRQVLSESPDLLPDA